MIELLLVVSVPATVGMGSWLLGNWILDVYERGEAIVDSE